jgi:hypothetical protein
MTTYLKDLLERAGATFAEGVLAVLGLDVIGALNADWRHALAVGATGGVLSVLKAMVARKVGDPKSASTVPSLTVGETRPGLHEA